MTFSISTKIQDPPEFEKSTFFPEKIILTSRGARNHKIVNRIDLQIKFCEPHQFMNRLGLKNCFNLDAKYYVSMNINVL